ncbi:Glycogen synthase [Serratia fonticola]|uniref:glycosyltransferase family 4 protein n=1 Tax=Serratia fonticola TaxID=47917 RepID=UPI002179FDA8|nr:glycosyltransferase family 4 protein [Serratia fonticola]CAI1766566.1 Glycogen synthase [Serratia fonticola]
MKVLVVHNKYLVEGGEDIVFKNETEALKKNGIEISYLIKDNEKLTFFCKIKLFFSSILSFRSFIDMKRAIEDTTPDIIHVHNFFPKFSPSIFWAAKIKKIPIVMTLHNYRIICPSATFFIDNEVNTRSIKGGPWWTLSRRVYKNSLIGTMSLCWMIYLNKKINTWDKVTKFICLTEFSKEIFVNFGIPSEKILIKPNLYPENIENIAEGDYRVDFDLPERFVLFVGRLTKDKGVNVILESLNENSYLTVIVGEGPLENIIKGCKNVLFLGRRSSACITYLMRKAAALLVPSLWFEGLPMVVVEAYANKLPVIASDIGSLSEVVINDVTGIHLNPGDKNCLSSSINKICSDFTYRAILSEGAYSYFSNHFEERNNIDMLVSIYKEVINESEF